MSQDLTEHLDALKDALRILKDTGTSGFEGLVALVLGQLAGQPFRLASSGSQRGRDGDSALDAGATYFEAKHYSNEVPRDRVLAKLAELGGDDGGQVDTWVLTATSPVSAQNHEEYVRVAAQSGIGILVLDWPTQGLPPLATALAAAREITAAFLQEHSTRAQVTQAATNALEAIARHPDFHQHSEKLRATLRQPALGMGLARAANDQWLNETFANRRQARGEFGQPLAPADDSARFQAVLRPQINAALHHVLLEGSGGKVVAVLGEEGCGKSWAVAQSWMVVERRPLMAVLTADHFGQSSEHHRLESVLVEALIHQTGDTDLPRTRRRWERRMQGWRENPQPRAPRLVVFLDGLNQAPDYDWSRWIDAAQVYLEKMGGLLIVTSRSHYFESLAQSGLSSPVQRVQVGRWSLQELREVLSANGVDPQRPSRQVLDSLTNPRLLGIALELLGHREIEDLDELNEDRLLFEYMRRAHGLGVSPLPLPQFAKALRQHAEEIVRRLTAGRRDDLTVFDEAFAKRLGAIAESRFFKPTVLGDPTAYELEREGLPLALGLWLQNAAIVEYRNGRDPTERLRVILEPLLPLDRTAEVIGAAVTTACCDSECPVDVTSALIRSFLDLQNASSDSTGPFAAMVRRVPGAFLRAARGAALSHEHVPRFRWMTAVLRRAREDEAVWTSMSESLHTWLNTYSLSVERRSRTHRSRDSEEDIKKERHRLEQEREDRLARLSPTEKQVLEPLQREDDGDLDGLHSLAFLLLAQRHLEQFAEPLRNWAFTNALSPSVSAPNREFRQLIRLNRAAWPAARTALMRAAQPLEGHHVSPTGHWALAAILQATGHPDDASRAAPILEHLTEDWPQLPGWRLVERYCATDPCDPSTSKPHNIDDTAKEYEAVDVRKLRTVLATTSEDHFFNDARPGLARFVPNVAAEVHRKFSMDVIGRDGLPRRQGVLALLPHSALLEPDVVDGLRVAGAAVPASAHDDDPTRDEWITSQYSLFVALPHLDGSRQLEVLAAMTGSSLLLPLSHVFHPAEQQVVRKHLDNARRTGDPDSLFKVLCFVHFSRSPVSSEALGDMAELLDFPHSLVRSYVLAIAGDRRARSMLSALIRSTWQAATLDDGRHFREIWYGSRALLAAVEERLADPEDVIDRIAPQFYTYLAALSGAREVTMVTPRVVAAVERVAALNEVPPPPPVERAIPTDDAEAPPLFGLRDNVDYEADIKEVFERFAEPPGAFESRQRDAWERFSIFRERLTRDGARLILDELSLEGIGNIVQSNPALADRWYGLLLQADDFRFGALHRLAVVLAQTIARSAPEKAATIFRRCTDCGPLLHFTVTPAGLPSEVVAMWKVADVAEIRELCFQQLDRAHSDSELAMLTLSAWVAGAEASLTRFVEERIAIGEPATIARAVTVSGFCPPNKRSAEVIDRFSEKAGFIGRACAAARYSYDRNVWAHEWFARMVSTNDRHEFWRCAVLLSKIVDGRYVLWQSRESDMEDPCKRFLPTIEAEIERRIKTWGDKRARTLFGETAPAREFIEP